MKIRQIILQPSEASLSSNDNWDWRELLMTDNEGNVIEAVRELGIYALPGVKFKIGDAEIVIGSTGLFNLADYDLPIKSLQISKDSYNLIKDNSGNIAIIDIVSESTAQGVDSDE